MFVSTNHTTFVGGVPDNKTQQQENEVKGQGGDVIAYEPTGGNSAGKV